MGWLRDLIRTVQGMRDVSPSIYALFVLIVIICFVALVLPNLSTKDFTVTSNLIIAIIYAILLLVFLGVFIVLFFFSLKKRERSDEIEDEILETKLFDNFYDGLQKLKDWLDTEYATKHDKRSLILWRRIAVEFTPDTFENNNQGINDALIPLIQWYQNFVRDFIQEGKADKQYWDEAIYGVLPIRGDSRRIKEARRKSNSATLQFIKENYLSTKVTCQTSGLGISQEAGNSDNIIIINKSGDGNPKPSAYLCAVKWSISPNGKPHGGQFITNPDTVRMLSDEFEAMREELLEESKQSFWYIDQNIRDEDLKSMEQKIDTFFSPHCVNKIGKR